MSDFVEKQWEAYCERLNQSAEFLAGNDGELQRKFKNEAKQIVEQDGPDSYTELLERIDESMVTVKSWQEASPVKSSATHLDAPSHAN